MYPNGLPTPDGVISLMITGLKVYRETRQADKKFEAAEQLLDSLDLALCLLEEISENAHTNDILRTQVHVARKAWHVLSDYLTSFNGRPGKENANTRISISKKLKWAFDELDGKLHSLYAQVELCFSAIMPALHFNTSQKIESILNELLELRKKSPPALNPSRQASNSDVIENMHQVSQVHNPGAGGLTVPCWERRRGCFCRCHDNSRITAASNRHLFVELAGFSSFFRICNVESCNGRRYNIQLRFAPSNYGLPFAFMAALELSTRWIPKISLSLPSVCRYTSPGFSLLWELERSCYDKFERSQKLAEIQTLLKTGEATFRDVDPSGKGWLEKLLRYPWPPGFRDDQWQLVEFFVRESPRDVLANPRLLHRCARWIGEGPHMDMLNTLLELGLDPGSTDARCFKEWPSFSSPGWISETITPDPFFVEWMRISLRREPGYANCDALSESILTGSMLQFEQALAKSKDARGLPHLSSNAFGQTAVHLAIILPTRLERLLEAGANPDPVDNGGSTPLMYAACYGYSESVRYLMKYTKHPMSVDTRNRRVFIDYAVRRNHFGIIETVVQILRAQGSNKGALSVLDRCLRYYFVSGCYADDLDLSFLDGLFALQADPDVKNGKSSLLHLAHSKKQVQRVLKAGFTAINVRDEEGLTPLMKTLRFSDLPLVKQLVGLDANVSCQDEGGWTVLHHLIQSAISQFTSTSTNLDDHGFKQWVNFVSTFHFLVKSGADCFLRDHCQCACSSTGCSAITVALHRTMKQTDSNFGGRISSVLVDLLCVIQNREDCNLRQYIQDVERYRRFVRSGLEHTCCYRKEEYVPAMGDKSSESILANHAEFDTSFGDYSPVSTSTRHEIVEGLARFFRQLENRANEAYKDRLRYYNPKEPLITYEIDKKNDNFIERISCPVAPKLSSVGIESSRDYLKRARVSLKGNGLQQRGTLNAYVDNALDILAEIKTVMQTLD